MRAVTIKEAKARLNELIDAATGGEQVVLMRGAKHVAAIVPITEDDIELVTTLTDAQAERFWHQLAEEQAAGKSMMAPTAEAAVSHLARSAAPAAAHEPKPRYGAAARPRKKSPSSKKSDRP